MSGNPERRWLMLCCSAFCDPAGKAPIIGRTLSGWVVFFRQAERELLKPGQLLLADLNRWRPGMRARRALRVVTGLRARLCDGRAECPSDFLYHLWSDYRTRGWNWSDPWMGSSLSLHLQQLRQAAVDLQADRLTLEILRRDLEGEGPAGQEQEYVAYRLELGRGFSERLLVELGEKLGYHAFHEQDVESLRVFLEKHPGARRAHLGDEVTGPKQHHDPVFPQAWLDSREPAQPLPLGDPGGFLGWEERKTREAVLRFSARQGWAVQKVRGTDEGERLAVVPCYLVSPEPGEDVSPGDAKALAHGTLADLGPGFRRFEDAEAWLELLCSAD